MDSSRVEAKDATGLDWFRLLVSLPILLGLLYYGRDFLIPLAVSALLFILTTALVDKIQSVKLGSWSPPGWLANLLSACIVVSGFLAASAFVASQSKEFGLAAPRYSERLNNFLSQARETLGTKPIEALTKALEGIDAAGIFAQIANQAGGFLSTLFLVLLYLGFFLAERNAFAAKIPKLASSEEGADRLKKMLDAINEAVKQYMWINAATSVMSGTVAYLVLKAVGVDFAATLAFIVFLVGFIPNIGAFLGVGFPALVAFLQFDTLTPCLTVIILYGGADQFISNVITPRMQGKSLNLSTSVVLVGLTFWSAIWGGVGAFLAVPLMVVGLIICSEVPGLRPFAVLMSGDGELFKT